MAEHPALPTFASPQPTGVPERSATGRSAQAVTSLEQHGVAPDTRLATPPTARPAPEGLATIRVTIGRVEVRAVTPPAPMTTQSAKGSPGPALSLDGYLKQRDEARR